MQETIGKFGIISCFIPIFPRVPPFNLAIPFQQKLLFRNEKDMVYHFSELVFLASKLYFLKAFEDWLNFGQTIR